MRIWIHGYGESKERRAFAMPTTHSSSDFQSLAVVCWSPDYNFVGNGLREGCVYVLWWSTQKRIYFSGFSHFEEFRRFRQIQIPKVAEIQSNPSVRLSLCQKILCQFRGRFLPFGDVSLRTFQLPTFTDVCLQIIQAKFTSSVDLRFPTFQLRRKLLRVVLGLLFCTQQGKSNIPASKDTLFIVLRSFPPTEA